MTIAAETGLPGLLFFAWVLVAAFRQALRRRQGSLALVAALGLAAIFCHSLFYADFFEDPATWGLFGLAALGAPQLAARAARPPAVEREQEAVPA